MLRRTRLHYAIIIKTKVRLSLKNCKTLTFSLRHYHEMKVRNHSRSVKMIPLSRSDVNFYYILTFTVYVWHNYTFSGKCHFSTTLYLMPVMKGTPKDIYSRTFGVGDYRVRGWLTDDELNHLDTTHDDVMDTAQWQASCLHKILGISNKTDPIKTLLKYEPHYILTSQTD